MEFLVIFESECMPGSNSCSATFFCRDSLVPPPFMHFRHLERPGIGYAIAKADLGFFNSPMTGGVAIATRDLRATGRENRIESKFGETSGDAGETVRFPNW
jgi:hypothetical protein